MSLAEGRADVFIAPALIRGVAVKLTSATTIPYTVALATSPSDAIMGITVTATQNGVVSVALPGSVCDMLLGGSVSVGEYISINSTGRGIRASGTGNYIAIAQKSGISGDYVPVEIIRAPISFNPWQSVSWTMNTNDDTQNDPFFDIFDSGINIGSKMLGRVIFTCNDMTNYLAWVDQVTHPTFNLRKGTGNNYIAQGADLMNNADIIDVKEIWLPDDTIHYEVTGDYLHTAGGPTSYTFYIFAEVIPIFTL